MNSNVNNYKIVVLISGRGSNLAALIKDSKYFKIIEVLSNKPEATGLQLAKNSAIPTKSYRRSDFQSLAQMKSAIKDRCFELEPDLVVLAGFMQIIEPDFIAAFPNRILNIHPSLLPAYPGLDTHARVLAAQEKKHGCSVHVVDTGIDTGKIIAQAAVDVAAKDTEETLAAKVLAREHQIYPWVLNNLAIGEIRLLDKQVVFSDSLKQQAKQLGFNIPI